MKCKRFTIGDTFAMSPKGATLNGRPVSHEVARAILGEPVADFIAKQPDEPRPNGIYVVTSVDCERGIMRIEDK